MAAPPTITENGALFLAQQETLKRSQRRSSKLVELLRSVWSATKTVIVRNPSSVAEKHGPAGPENIPGRTGTNRDAKIVTVVRKVRRS
jgi:hypothetical protein